MSAYVWDTTLISRLRPGAGLLDDVNLRARSGQPVGMAMVSVFEVSYGMSKAAQAGRSDFGALLAWFGGFVVSGVARVFGLGADGALLAGEVRARLPVPPEGRRRRTRSKAEARVAWAQDIQIACTAWAAGYDIATIDVDHFGAIARCVNTLMPDGPALTVTDQPPVCASA